MSISSRSCYPLNTILVDRTKLDNYLATHSNAYESSDDSDDSDTEGGSSSSVIIESDTFMHERHLLTSFFFLFFRTPTQPQAVNRHPTTIMRIQNAWFAAKRPSKTNSINQKSLSNAPNAKINVSWQ